MTNNEKNLGLENIRDEHLIEFALIQDISFKNFLDSCPYPVWCKDYTTRKGTMIFISNRFDQIFNIKPKDYLRKTDFDIWPNDIAEGMREHDLAAIDSDEIISVQEVLRSKTGNIQISKEWEVTTVFKWAAFPDVFGYRFTLVYGMAMPAGANEQ